jgi:GDP-L-fucose synthase
MIKKNSKIFIAGHNGLVGNAIYRLLKKKKYKKLLTVNRNNLDLTNKKKVQTFFEKQRPEFVIMCAAKVGGILENKNYQLDFLLDNTEIQNNILLLAKKFKVKRVIFLGSSCIYPKNSKIPIKEDYIMTGKLEKTNEAYAMSKLYGIKLSSILYEEFNQDIVCLMPTNLYGIEDNFDIKSSHVIPGLITKFLNSKKNKTNIKVWGTGKAIREFMYVDDLANAIFRSLITPKSKLIKIFKNKLPIINVGTGEYVSIFQLVKKIKKIVKFEGKILFDKNFPDGTLIKNLDSSKIKKLKWRPKIRLNTGLKKVINSRVKLIN